MNPENAVEVHEITKKFKVYYDKGHTLKEKTLFYYIKSRVIITLLTISFSILSILFL